MINRRWPYVTGKNIVDKINRGLLDMGDLHVSTFPQNLSFGFFTKETGGGLDIGIIEATEITRKGGLILGGAIGSTPEIVNKAEKLIIEVCVFWKIFIL